MIDWFLLSGGGDGGDREDVASALRVDKEEEEKEKGKGEEKVVRSLSDRVAKAFTPTGIDNGLSCGTSADSFDVYDGWL